MVSLSSVALMLTMLIVVMCSSQEQLPSTTKEVMYPKDIVKQTRRMWENVEALLKEADCTFEDVGEMVVYLRDIADYDLVCKLFEERFPKKPYVIVQAPVCRPSWLVEMECMATKSISAPSLPAF